VYQWRKEPFREEFGMHWRPLAFALVLAHLALMVVAAPVALAGGWAVTTLDTVPQALKAGEAYPIGYTIRQHGQMPFVGADSAIVIRDPRTGASQRFVGEADGQPGHYVAQVRFPEPGEWEWSADQKPFQSQPLGAITVLPLVAPSVPLAQPLSPVAEPAVEVAEPAVEVAEPATGSVGVPVLVVASPEPVLLEPAVVDTTWYAPIRIGLPFATLVAIGVFGWRLVSLVRPARQPTRG
jgi:hypothetical protein